MPIPAPLHDVDLNALASALPLLVQRFDGFVAQDVGPKLSCSEAEALAAVLAACGATELAAYWLAAHGEGDEPNDEPGTMGDRHRHLWEASQPMPAPPCLHEVCEATDYGMRCLACGRVLHPDADDSAD